jgi:hypothetical protein
MGPRRRPARLVPTRPAITVADFSGTGKDGDDPPLGPILPARDGGSHTVPTRWLGDPIACPPGAGAMMCLSGESPIG